jgi:hypothetical protein
VPVVPLDVGRGWASLRDTFAWDDANLTYLKAQVIARCTTAPLLRGDLGEGRLYRIKQFHHALTSTGMKPPPSILAEWIEQVATDLGRGADSQDWDLFYDDVAELFAETPDDLHGRAILLDEDRKVRPCGRQSLTGEKARVTVFFQPVRERIEGQQEVEPDLDVHVPSSLRKYITYMHPNLRWYTQQGNAKRLKTSQVFFERHGLIQRYETRGILENVSNVLSRSNSEQVFQDALTYVFRLHMTVGNIQRPSLSEIGLRVPTRSGWIRSNGACFSVDWTDTDGELLERLIGQAKGLSADLESLSERLLLPPSTWPFSIKDSAAWVEFLKKIGVRDGLWPQGIRKSNTQWIGQYIQPDAVARDLKLTAKDAEIWVPTVKAHGGSASYVTTPYVLPLFVHLPGQSDHHCFNAVTKGTYARLLLRGLDKWAAHFLTATIRRPSSASYTDSFQWPTPLDAFIRHAYWLPISQAGNRDQEEFVSIDQAWHFRDNNRDAYPTYARLLAADVRQFVESSHSLRELLLEHGLPVWGDSKNAATLLPLLAKLYLSDSVDEAQLAGFRKTYERALGDVANTQVDLFSDGTPLLVLRNGRIIAVANHAGPGTRHEPLYVKAGPTGLSGHILENLGVPIVSVPDGLVDRAVSLLTRGFGDRVKRVSDLHVKVLVDHEVFTPTTRDPLLTDEVPWIEDFVALTMEFRSNRFDHRMEAVQRRTLERLARIRLRRAEHVKISLDGYEVDNLPPFLQDAIPIRDEVYPTLVVLGNSHLQWSELRALAPALAEILVQTSLENGLSLCILEMERRLGEPVRNPTEQDYAEVFRTQPHAVRQLLALTKGPTRTVLYKLYPIMAYMIGLEDAERFNPTGGGGDLGSSEAVEAALVDIADRLPYAISELLSACTNAESVAYTRDMLRIDYAGFNRTLSRLGTPYTPIHNVEGHRQAFDFFIQSHRDAILLSIRTLVLPDFEQGNSLTRYIKLRELSDLEPDARWLNECNIPPDILMQRHVDEWLHQIGAPAMGQGDSSLMPLHEVREKNARMVQDFAPDARGVVRAWCWKRSTQYPPVWGQMESFALRLAEMAGAEGIMDFRPLTAPNLIAWLSRTSRWPGGMDLTISPEALGLSEQDLRAEQNATDNERRRREQVSRSIVLDGVQMSADQADFRAIIDHVSQTLSPELLTTPARFAGLEPIGGLGSKATGGSGGGSGGRSRTRLSEVQTTAIGLIGELVAYRWLQAKYPEIGDECWKSTYRNVVLGGAEGNDSLGCDFVVMGKSGPLYFEVKATSGDTLELELGETEVALASKVARTNHYRIIFIRHALDSSQRSIHMLPNPLSTRGTSLYRTIGRGLRYEFSLAQ